MKIIVTGGAGFIGVNLIQNLLREGHHVVNLDKMTYAANPDILKLFPSSASYSFSKMDVCDAEGVRALFSAFQPDAVMHLAAESHVDRSIDGPAAFIHTNIVGTFCFLEAAYAYWKELPAARQESFRFHHISTDEVYGSLGAEGFFTEETPYHPNSPYSASKASSDHLVRAWHTTYGLPVLITNSSNNYGSYQFPEKLVPLMITRGLSEQELPLYGDGENVRDWLYVEDHVRALSLVLQRGQIGRTYNIGGNQGCTNKEIVQQICCRLDEKFPPRTVARRADLIRFVPDRPGHDRRYATDTTRLKTELGWEPKESLESGLDRTIAWYLDHQTWWQNLVIDDTAEK